MSDLSVEDFRAVQGDPFAVQDGDGLTLVLGDVRGLGRAFAEREAFVLTFDGPPEPHLPQGQPGVGPPALDS